jgi:hypothetical protein
VTSVWVKTIAGKRKETYLLLMWVKENLNIQ